MNVEDDIIMADVDVSGDLAEREAKAMKVTLCIGAGALLMFALVAMMMRRCKEEQGSQAPVPKFSEIQTSEAESIEMAM